MKVFKSKTCVQALRHLLKVAASTNDDSEALNLAIEVVGSSGQAHLARQLIEFLMGETDGVPKDAKVSKKKSYFFLIFS